MVAETPSIFGMCVHQDKVVWLLLHGGNGLLAVGVGGIAASISFARDPPSTGTISGKFDFHRSSI
jgi:hypothetical protein